MDSILLIEDDQNLSEALTKYLIQEGFLVIAKSTLCEAQSALQQPVSAIILDWMLPDGQGIDFLRSLRKLDLKVPVIFLTARADLVDKIIGLEVGANDYMTKPFQPRELIARLRTHIRTSQGLVINSSKIENFLEDSGIRLNTVSRQVLYNGFDVDLTKMEFHLLKLFLENPNHVFPREELLNQVWGYDNYPTTRTVDNHILQLRQKFDSSLFETLRGVGYRFRPNKK
ncbi:MAG: response regulator transcription factor [Pseudobdellovibrio sp.]